MFKTRINLTMLFVAFYITSIDAQINIVKNPGFEQILSCPSNFGQIDSVVDWGDLENGGGGTPDFYNSCSTNPTMCGIPFNLSGMGYQNTHSGNSYVGIQVASSSTGSPFREYVQGKLFSNLIAGHSYCVSFHSNLSNHAKGYIEPMGAYLDSGSVFAIANGIASVSPQVYSNIQLNDSVNWTKTQGTFIADGTENYISIGNFYDDSSSNIGVFGTPPSWTSYYYIDDVSVIDISTPAFAGNDILINPGDSTYIGRPQEIGLNEDCIWSVAGLPTDTIAGMWVKPTTTTTYILQQSICGTVNYDTVTVSVVGTGIGETNIDDTYTVFPNPSSGEIYLNTNNNSKLHTAEVWIYDITGSLVSKTILSSGSNRVAFDLQTGVYFVSVKDSKGLIGKPKKVTVIR